VNIALRTMLVRGALVATGGIAGAGGAVALQTTGARETITLAVGDTITPRHTVKTDSILEVVSTPAGQRIVAKRCGSSFIYLRTWRGLTQLSADTITAIVPCPVDSTKTASVQLFNRFGSDSSGKVIGFWDDSMSVGKSRCVYVVARNAFGKILTGKVPTMSSSDTLVAKFHVDSIPEGGPGIPLGVCPDTTIDPGELFRGQVSPPPFQTRSA